MLPPTQLRLPFSAIPRILAPVWAYLSTLVN